MRPSCFDSTRGICLSLCRFLAISTQWGGWDVPIITSLSVPHPAHENMPLVWHIFMFGIYSMWQGGHTSPVTFVEFIWHDEGGGGGNPLHHVCLTSSTWWGDDTSPVASVEFIQHDKGETLPSIETCLQCWTPETCPFGHFLVLSSVAIHPSFSQQHPSLTQYTRWRGPCWLIN